MSINKTGAELAVFALEQIGVKFTFGIPGVHNTEIYDEVLAVSNEVSFAMAQKIAKEANTAVFLARIFE